MKIAFLGCAHIHTPAFVSKINDRPGTFSVAAVWDHDAARAAKNAELLHSKVAATPEDILNDPEVKAVIICSETNLHKELVMKAVAAKKNLYVEKPLGFSAADAAEMANAVEKAGLIFSTGYFMRGMSAHLFLKKQIAAGAFGTITRVRHSNCHSGSLGGWFDTEWRWMADPSIAGCGAFGDLGTHSLDIIMWLLGEPAFAFASIHNLTKRYGEACDEYGEGTLVYANGMIATIAAGWVDMENPVVCEICGTKGHAVIMNGQVYFHSELVEGSDMAQPVKDLPAELPHAFDLYLDKLEGKDVPLVGVQEAAARNRVMETMYRANAEKRLLPIA